MNGQMYQIACIVAAARKALKSVKKIWYKPEKYTNKMSFQILPSEKGEVTELAVTDWFENLKEKGLKDLRLFCPISVNDRSILGFSNTTQSSILCFYKDGRQVISYQIGKLLPQVGAGMLPTPSMNGKGLLKTFPTMKIISKNLRTYWLV